MFETVAKFNHDKARFSLLGKAYNRIAFQVNDRYYVVWSEVNGFILREVFTTLGRRVHFRVY